MVLSQSAFFYCGLGGCGAIGVGEISNVVIMGRWSEEDSSSWEIPQRRILSSSQWVVKIRSIVLLLLLVFLVIVPLSRARLRLAVVAISIRLSERLCWVGEVMPP